MKELDPSGPWRRRRGASCWTPSRPPGATGSSELWRTRSRSPAFAGGSESIAAMVDYACHVTERVLERALADDGYLTRRTAAPRLPGGPLRRPAGAVQPRSWSRRSSSPGWTSRTGSSPGSTASTSRGSARWSIVAGRPGRPTAGVTRESNSVAGVIHAASRGRLPEATPADRAARSGVRAVRRLRRRRAPPRSSSEYRPLWSRVMATSRARRPDVRGLPAVRPARARRPRPHPGHHRACSEMPTVGRPRRLVRA